METVKIEGTYIRKELERIGYSGNLYRVCCGGRKFYNKNYDAQLRALGVTGDVAVTENGIVVGRYKL